MNKQMIIGNIGNDPELEYLPTNGTPVVNLRIATTEYYKDRQSGESKEHTEWHNVEFFGRAAETISEYGHKGRKIFVAGPTRRKTYEDRQTGQEKQAFSILAREWEFVGPRQADKPPQADGPPASTRSKRPAAKAAEPKGSDFDDDIPF